MLNSNCHHLQSPLFDMLHHTYISIYELPKMIKIRTLITFLTTPIYQQYNTEWLISCHMFSFQVLVYQKIAGSFTGKMMMMISYMYAYLVCYAWCQFWRHSNLPFGYHTCSASEVDYWELRYTGIMSPYHKIQSGLITQQKIAGNNCCTPRNDTYYIIWHWLKLKIQFIFAELNITWRWGTVEVCIDEALITSDQPTLLKR